ncbi:D-alanyl-D-alanine carboxypeptidase family protein [Sporolactobacillus inulinus]|jgi:D-alanyl-D-alanine carboxypeptidase (penicillin-binding protein 5/6)|nr:D-alanyl-D-alanine carboxypeptidase family protein [Sporolactobacillus inulinus]GEB77127.1 D-alanyl-D-alanine carboxypeptidase [Sporolactobacillus inulinus]
MKVFSVWMICASLLFASFVPAGSAFAEQKNKADQEDGKLKSAIVMEQETGKILFANNENKKLPPASMTKVMTLLLIFKALKSHQLTLKDKINVSEHAASMGGSQVFLEPGESMTVDEMLKAICIASANDASVAMAEHIAGSEKAFVEKMNHEAERLGMKNTHFVNPTGLPVANHYTTAHDMAIMARALIKFPEVLHYTSKYEDYLRENTDKKFWLVNTNKLIKTYPGADGLKTGFTNDAKYCLTATAQRNGMRVVAVVMGAPTPKERNKEIAGFMDNAFANYSTKLLLKKHKPVAMAKVNKGDQAQVPIVTQQPTVLLLKKGEGTKGIEKTIKMNKALKAPIKSGTVVGQYIVMKKGKVLSKTPLIVKDQVKRATWWQLFKRSAGSILTH